MSRHANQPRATASDSVQLDADQTVPIPQGADEDQVRIIAMPQIAVVCDLCSDLPGKQPACVVECPHEAAFRFDAGTKFPSGEFL